MTTVVLRLQGLHTDAGFTDIRRFFHGLEIPEGAIHITGGEMGEAFVIFNTEKDGLLALRQSGKPLRGSVVTLQISSMEELTRNIELRVKNSKQKTTNKQTTQTKTNVVPPSSPDPSADLLLSLMSAVQGSYSNNTEQLKASLAKCPKRSGQNQTNLNQTICKGLTKINSGTSTQGIKSEIVNEERNFNDQKPGYLRLYGFPHTIDKQEVLHFLRGLSVLEVITNVRLQLGRCCLVKLASFAEAEEGLKYSLRKFKEFNIEIRLAHEKMWKDVKEQPANTMHDIGQICVPKEMERSEFQRIANKRSAEEPPQLGSPKRFCQNAKFPQSVFYVMVNNLWHNITKTEIRNIFCSFDLPNYRIKHLLDKWGERTRTAFVTFYKEEEYNTALNMNGIFVNSRNIQISSITKAKINDLIQKNRFIQSYRSQAHGHQY